MKYDLPLEVRLRKARQRQERYASDPDYRLRCVNRERAKRGLPLAANVNDILTRQETAMRGVEGRRAVRG